MTLRNTDDAPLDTYELECVRGKELITMTIPEERDLVSNLFREQSLNFLAGEEGCGKSLLAMNLAMSVALGLSKFLNYEVRKEGKVLYLNNELSLQDFSLRLRRMSVTFTEVQRSAMDNLIVPVHTQLLSECWNGVNDFCGREGPVLFILDCLYFAHDRDEKDNTEMKSVMRQLIALRNNHKLTVLVVHHTKKGTRGELMHNDHMRGAGVFGQAADTVLMLRRSQTNEEQRVIKQTKQRHGSDAHRRTRLLSLNGETLWFEDRGEVSEASHISTPFEVPSGGSQLLPTVLGGRPIWRRKEILEACQRFKMSDKTVDRWIDAAVEQGYLVSAGFGTYKVAHLDMDNHIQK